MKAKQRFGFLATIFALLLFLLPTAASAATGDADKDPALREAIGASRFAEPLVPAGPTTSADDKALLTALEAYRQRKAPGDVGSIVAFLSEHPHSAWAPALLTNLGLTYLHDGYFSRALDAWQTAWREGKDATDPAAKALVDRAVGELARLQASLGKNEELAALFDEIGDRPISGSATEAVQDAREEMSLAKRDPSHLFNCGPRALRALMLSQNEDPNKVEFLQWYRVGENGTNLAELGKLADKVSYEHHVIFREPGQPVPMPAVMQWKVGHFAAIVGKANGRFHIKDAAIAGGDLWVTPAALDAEASGYFMVPADAPPDAGWRTVDDNEAATIWGKGPTTGTAAGTAGAQDPPANPPPPPEKDCGLCAYNIGEATVSVTLADTPVGYTPPIGPSAKVRIAYSQRESSQPANFSFFNISQKWTLNWLTYVTDDPTNPGATVSRYLAGGGAYYYTDYDSTTGRFATESSDGSVLVLASQSPVTYRRQMGDGSVEIYAESDGSVSYPRRVFLSQVIDPQGNTLTLNYDGMLRLTSLTDATGRQTTFDYELAARPLLVTKITDPFGRSARLTYDSIGRLSSITDVIGLTSWFTYDSNSLVDSLITPYGTTTFSYTAPGTSGPPRFVEVTDPMGYHEREEWLEPAPIPDSDPAAAVPSGMPLTPTNQYLSYRDSFHWDKDAYVAAGCTPTGGCDYTKARISHFLHSGNTSERSAVLESIKYPLENRIWFNYPGQTNSVRTGNYGSPIAAGRVLDDGTTQLTQTSYDTEGYYKVTKTVDPLGRTTSFTYGNQIDLSAISQTTAYGVQKLIAQFTYNDHHRPVFYTDAAGETTAYTYNDAGQVASVTNPLGQTTSYHYNTTGDLTEIVNANSETAASFTYDSYDRVRTYTDSEGWEVTYDYDAADRVTKITYPDGTTDLYTYDRLDLVSYTDRLGRTWRYAYDANRRLTVVTDPEGKLTQFGYNGIGKLTSLTDPSGNTTSWSYDVEGRPILKTYADSSTITYSYESTTSRLHSVLDALSQTKQYSYAQDDRLTGITYLSAVNTTPNVSFAYDPYFPLLASMTDGTGTTQYSYGPLASPGALLLAQETGPLASSTISYNYDELGRLASRTVMGAGAETFGYDDIGRQTSHGSDLGAFTLSYLGETAQITARQLTGSTLETSWGYLSNSSDRRLASIDNTGLVAGQYSNFTFTSKPEALIMGATETSDASSVYPTNGSQTASYNNLNQLTNLSGQTLTWDADGNLLSDGVRTYAWDAENRLVKITYPGTAGKETDFVYDGLSRRTAITSIPAGGGGGTTISYLWCGMRICQARDATNATIREYYAEGEYVPGSPAQPYYYGPDQIGSVRRAFASTTSAPAYAYDPYGQPLQATAPVTDFNYAGMFYNADSGLYLTQYRAYDSTAGRWLSRDRLGEVRGPDTNVYAYVGSNPLFYVDPRGLAGTPPPGTPSPDNIPGGPWTWADNPQNPRGGQFVGPKPPGGGQRTACTWADAGPNNPEPYWKTYTPVPGGNADTQRYNMAGEKISPDEAHPGISPTGSRPPVPPGVPLGLAVILGIVFYSTPAY